jgi:sentrin-specific protease 1
MCSSILPYLNRYLRSEHQDKKNEPFNDDGWTLVAKTLDALRQHNGSDCGVFTCMYANCLSLNKVRPTLVFFCWTLQF